MPSGLVEVPGWWMPVTEAAVISSWQTMWAKRVGTKQVAGKAEFTENRVTTTVAIVSAN